MVVPDSVLRKYRAFTGKIIGYLLFLIFSALKLELGLPIPITCLVEKSFRDLTQTPIDWILR